VEERLPEVGVEVLTLDKFTNISVGEFRVLERRPLGTAPEWETEAMYAPALVTHWQPKPEPPKWSQHTAHQSEVAYRRGWIMATQIPPTTVNGAVIGRPLGLNPYELWSPEYYAWDAGYWAMASVVTVDIPTADRAEPQK
jgi:hypothetical protein